MDKYILFLQLPHPTILVDQCDAYRLIEANESFYHTMIPKNQAIKLSFLHDILSANERSIFLSNIEIMASLKKNSISLTPMKTLTLEGEEKCKLIHSHIWLLKP